MVATMRDAACQACKFFNADTSECRKSPPVRLPRRFDSSATAGNRVRDEELLWGWPIVKADDWCGEFSRRERR